MIEVHTQICVHQVNIYVKLWARRAPSRKNCNCTPPLWPDLDFFDILYQKNLNLAKEATRTSFISHPTYEACTARHTRAYLLNESLKVINQLLTRSGKLLVSRPWSPPGESGLHGGC